MNAHSALGKNRRSRFLVRGSFRSQRCIRRADVSHSAIDNVMGRVPKGQTGIPLFVPFRLTRANQPDRLTTSEVQQMGRRHLILAIALFFAMPLIASAQEKSKAPAATKPAPKLKVGDIAP